MTEQELETEKARVEAAAAFLDAEIERFSQCVERHNAFARQMIGQMAFHSFIIFVCGLVTGAALMRMFLQGVD
jgi:hypothetical protein